MTRLRAFGSDTFRSLRGRNFRLFFAGQIISQTGTWMQMIAIGLLVLAITDSGVAVGMTLSTAPTRWSGSIQWSGTALCS